MTEVLERSGAAPDLLEQDEAEEPSRLVVHFAPAVKMSDEQFLRFCEQNGDLQMERNADGTIVIMSPENCAGASGNARLLQLFMNWADEDGTGEAFGSSAGFKLPNTAVRGPDVAWILSKRLAKLTRKEWGTFAPITPDFVLELRSKSDSLRILKLKMEEYLCNGVRLGWLLDPKGRRVFIYQPNKRVQVLHDPAELSGEPVLRGFRLQLPPIWERIERGL